MGIAERMAGEIKRQREETEQQTQLARQWQLEASKAVERHTPAMWDSLVEIIKTEVGEFSQLEKSARNLTVSSLTQTHLLVQTSAFPILKVNVMKTYDGYVSVDMTQIISGFGPTKQTKPKRFRFTVDEQLSPCLVDEDDRHYTAGMLAEEILKTVFAFFADEV